MATVAFPNIQPIVSDPLLHCYLCWWRAERKIREAAMA